MNGARGWLGVTTLVLVTTLTASGASAQIEESCDPETAIVPCEEEPSSGGGHPNPAVPACSSGTSTAGCSQIGTSGCWECAGCAIYPSTDKDCDGLPDSLELELARRFFPHMWVRWFNADLRQFYGRAVVDKGKAVPFSIKPIPGARGFCTEAFQCLQIVYPVLYNWDCGDNPGTGCDSGLFAGAHRGDSEFYAAYIARRDPTGGGAWGVSWSTARSSASHWRLVMDFASAHFSETFDSSHNMLYGALDRAANIYVAEGKHAMYHSVDTCDGGGVLGADHCEMVYSLRGCFPSLGYCYSDQFFFNIGDEAELNGYNVAGGDAWTYAPDFDKYGTADAVDGAYYFWGNGSFGDASSFAPRLSQDFQWLRKHDCALRLPGCTENIVFNTISGRRFYHKAFSLTFCLCL